MMDVMKENKQNSVLIVDDERSNISTLRSILSPDYTVYASSDGEDAIETAEEFVPDLILLDIIMPGMDGYDVITELKASEKTQHIPVIFITGLNNTDAEEKGLAMGAADYIQKPFNSVIVKLRVQNQINLVNHTHMLYERTVMLQQRTERLLRLQNSMASVLASIAENRDKLSGRHVEKVAEFSKTLLSAMLERGLYTDEINEWDFEIIVSSSFLHDIGKIAIPDSILNKPGKLTADEFKIMKTHAIEGERIIDDIIAEGGDEDFLHKAKIFAGNHHERWDGTGYPRGLKGENIPLQGRVLAIADVYEALVSDRPYRSAFTHDKALEIISESKGSHFDPQIVDVFLEIAGELA